MANTNYSLLSLNVRGLNNFSKRKAVFRWLEKSKFDIILLQETHTTSQLESLWRREWSGPIFFSHGTGNSRGCCMLIRDTLDFKTVKVNSDRDGRFQIVQSLIADSPITIINVYGPNLESEQVKFFKLLDETLSKNDISNLNDLIIGGDWNVIRDAELDKAGGNYYVKKRSIECMDALIAKFDLNDTWRIKHPNTKRFSWRQSSPLVQCRLDYWLISDSLFDKVNETDIIPSIRSDHSAITLKFQNIPLPPKGPNFWKFNSSLLNDKNYTDEMLTKLQIWRDNYDIEDKQIKWELLKYEIRKYTIEYSKKKKREANKIKTELEKQLCHLERNLSKENNINKYNETKQKLKKIDDDIINGQIIRSKVQWYEEGERSSKYFLGLEKSRSVKKHIQKLKLSNGNTTTEPVVILKTAAEFYQKLYTSKTKNYELNYDDIFRHTKKLNEIDKDSCEGGITIQECSNVVNSLKKNKTPGNDGITSEFYQHFWPQVGDFMVDSFNYAYEKGNLSPSQKQAVITLIDKGKDRCYIENWRPISILNVDYKIASKVLTQRLQDKIPKLVGINQTGFVKGRFINDTIRALYDVIEYCNETETSGLLMMVDFEKAFDSLEWDFLFKTLEHMNFGISFINWVKLFYNNIESCVSNNGISSPYFKIQRGVRQGDPLSAYLFILCVEIMSNLILRNNSIRGITINDNEFKLFQYADDTTAILKDEPSAREFLSEIKHFGHVSGLNINTSKTKAINLGINPIFKLPDNIKWCNKPLRVLGIYVGWNLIEANEVTFKEKITNIKKLLNSWKARKLTLNGKVLIIKSLAISQIIYLLNLLPFPDDINKELESAIYEFLWNSKTHKVKKSVMIQNFKDGGYKMIDLRTLNITQKLKWIKLYLNGHDCQWRCLMEAFVNVKNLNIFLRSDYDMNDKLTKSTFYSEVLNNLYKLNTFDRLCSHENLKNQFIFYNKKIKIGGKLLYDNELFQAGLWKCCDLYRLDGRLVPFSIWKARGVPNCKYITWRAIVSIVRNLHSQYNMLNVCTNVSNKCILLPNEDLIDVQSSSSQDMYSKIVKLRKEKPTALKSHLEHFSLNEQEIENMFVLPRMCTNDMVIKEFQYKILHKYLPTNYLLHKMKMIESQKCTFCNLYRETIIHVFFDCVETKNIWYKIQTSLAKIDSRVVKLTRKDVILGYDLEKISPSNMLINNVILHVKAYLWKCKVLFLNPSYIKLKEYIENKKQLESCLEIFYDQM